MTGVLLTAAPSPLWYMTRAAGTVSFLLLSAAVILGMAQTVRFTSAFWPKYLTVGLHRNLSLLVVVFLALHIVTALLDPFAKLGWRDALIPFASWYRPLWLGLGVVAAELFAALVVTSLARKWLGYRAWRWLHWTAYVCWPVALLHGLGTGTDPRRPWFLELTTAAVIAVLVFLVLWRLVFGWPKMARWRMAAAASTSVALVGISLWALSGPLAPGWATVSGTPIQLLAAGGALHTPSPSSSPVSLHRAKRS